MIPKLSTAFFRTAVCSFSIMLAACTTVSTTAPPPELGIPGFYTQYRDADGIPVVSSGKVAPEALVAAEAMIEDMLKNRPDLRAWLAREGYLVSFGIEAVSPHTGYGYLLRGGELPGGYALEAFVEKPDLETAEKFLADGRYSWNGGIFAFGRERFLEELAAHRPEMARLCEDAIAQGRADGQVFRPAEAPFSQIEGDSVDYAVMENTAKAAMVPVSMGWSDIGNWDALREARGGKSTGEHELRDCTNVMVDSDGPRVSVVGMEDVIVVVDGDDILVTNARGAQGVGKLEGVSRP